MNSQITMGSFLEGIKKTDSMVKITLFPSDLVSYWSRCGLTADFGASFYSFCFPDTKVVRNTLSYILNEIVENSVKYSARQKSPIKVCLYEQNPDLVFEVQNYITESQKKTFTDYILHLQQVPDISQEFMEMVEKNIQNPDKSGLGILTILNDFGLSMAFDFSSTDENYGLSVKVQVKITQGDLNAEN